MKIPRCTAIGFLENLQNDAFKEIYAVDEKKMEEEVSMAKTIPKTMSNEDKEKFLEIFKHATSLLPTPTYEKNIIKNVDASFLRCPTQVIFHTTVRLLW
jgi:hypothetical protein